ncbi:MAG: ParM/StbA family protein [Bacillota bacterium]|nr:ParM/StbA family protein [Bacillota bacterium]
MLKIGIDGGNNTVITAVEGREPLIIPTILANYRDYNQGLEKIDQTKKPVSDCLDVEVILNYRNDEFRNGLGRFYIGNLAKEMEGINVRERNIGRIKKGDNGLLICMLASLAVVAAEAQNINNGRVYGQIKMVTGLPCLQYLSDREDYAKQFLGCHKVIIRGNCDLEIDLDICAVEVEMEGAGALKRLILNDQGEYLYKEEELIDRTILGLEVGEFTSEIIALTFKESEEGKVITEFKQKLCMGIDVGIANAKQPVIDFLREKSNTIIDRYDIDFALRRKQRRGFVDLEDGSAFNIVELFEENLMQLANTLIKLINNKVKSSGEKGRIKHTLLYGGGVCVLDYKMGNFLKDKIQELIGGKSSIVENPHTANALSYLDRALEVCGKPAKRKVYKNKINFEEQKRMIFNPGDIRVKREPKMPLQIVLLDSGVIWEAKSIRGAVAAVIGNEYLDTLESISEWDMRVGTAHKEAEKANRLGRNTVVFDTEKGIIKNDSEDIAINLEHETKSSQEPFKIRVENDRLFLLSLIKIGSIKILERKDTYFLRPHQKWNVLMQSNGALQCCSNCLHRINDKRIICPVYNTEKEQIDGTDCGSYTIYPGSYTSEYSGGEYTDISNECQIDDLFNKVGQLWMINNKN